MNRNQQFRDDSSRSNERVVLPPLQKSGTNPPRLHDLAAFARLHCLNQLNGIFSAIYSGLTQPEDTPSFLITLSPPVASAALRTERENKSNDE